MTNAMAVAFEDELARSARRMRVLEDIGALLRQLDDDDDFGAGVATVPEAPRSPPRLPQRKAVPARQAPARRHEPDALYERIRCFVVAEGPVAYGDIASIAGATKSTLLLRLRWLIEDGAIAAEGRPPHRRYCAPKAARVPDPRPNAALAAVASCAGPEELLALIREQAPVSSSRLRELTGEGYPKLVAWGRELARRRDVTFRGDGPDRVWELAGAPVLASEVLAVIGAEPGALNERRIALALRAKYQDVVDACSELLDGGAVTLTDANTYLPVQRAATGTGR